MTTIQQTASRAEQISSLTTKIGNLVNALETYVQARLKNKKSQGQSLADQEVEHAVPVEVMWNRNDPDVKPFADAYDRLRAQDSYYDRTSGLGKDWARKFNPHYKG